MHNNPTNITKQYFAYSNVADLSAIKSMFHPQATYSSANTGLYYGVDDIMTMMTHFFAQFSALEWQIDEIKANNAHIVEVAFTLHAIDLNDCHMERSGIERLVVVDGLIKHIEVR